jgi:hypothetical protein
MFCKGAPRGALFHSCKARQDLGPCLSMFNPPGFNPHFDRYQRNNSIAAGGTDARSPRHRRRLCAVGVINPERAEIGEARPWVARTPCLQCERPSALGSPPLAIGPQGVRWAGLWGGSLGGAVTWRGGRVHFSPLASVLIGRGRARFAPSGRCVRETGRSRAGGKAGLVAQLARAHP